MRYFLISALTSLALTAMPAVHADALDDQFLSQVRAQGVTVDASVLINAGRSICNSVGTPAAMPIFLGLQGQGLSPPQVSNVLMAGVRTYCPEKAGLVHLP